MEEKNRVHIEWIDFLRCFAIMSVVLCHVTENVYSLNVEFMSQVSLESRIFAIVAFTCGRLGVPIFLFISGYLLLGKVYDNKKCVYFWKHNLFPLFFITEIWIIFYNVFLSFWGQPFDVRTLIANMLFMKPVGISHMWYMSMILGIYLFIPFVSNALHVLDVKLILFPMSIAFICLFFPSILGTIFRINVGSNLGLDFSGGIYGICLVAGGLVRREKNLIRMKTVYLYMVAVIMFICAVLMQLSEYKKQNAYNIWYNNAFLVISAFMLFYIISKVFRSNCSNIIKLIAKYSFGIYLVHNLIIILLKHYCKFRGPLPIIVLFLWIGTFLISVLIIHVISRQSKIGRFVFWVKG